MKLMLKLCSQPIIFWRGTGNHAKNLIAKHIKWSLMVMCGLCFALMGCASHVQQSPNTTAYTPAVTASAKTEITRYVPMPVPGQLMPVPKPSKSKVSRTLKGKAAVNAANKRATRLPISTNYINSVMTYDYMPGALYQIYCAPLHVTDIQFASGEKIISVAAGDTLRWQVSKTYSGGAGAPMYHLVIKPVSANLQTDMVVMTNQRTYHIKLISTSGTFMASVKWRYPQGDGLVQTFSKEPLPNGVGSEGSGPTNLNVNQLDFNYTTQLTHGATPDWYPKMVFNDGVRTYIQLPHNMQDAPTLFIGHDQKTEQIVNYRVKGNYYIVDTVFQNAELRSGQKGQTIVQITRG